MKAKLGIRYEKPRMAAAEGMTADAVLALRNIPVEADWAEEVERSFDFEQLDEHIEADCLRRPLHLDRCLSHRR